MSVQADARRVLREVALGLGVAELAQDRGVRLARQEEFEGAAYQVGRVRRAVAREILVADGHAVLRSVTVLVDPDRYKPLAIPALGADLHRHGRSVRGAGDIADGACPR